MLLLMPSVGKKLLPQRLQHLLNDESQIKDLFPDPCPECIEWKDKLKKLIKPSEDASEDIVAKYKAEFNKINQEYATHISKSHPIKELPIKRLHDAVNQL